MESDFKEKGKCCSEVAEREMINEKMEREEAWGIERANDDFVACYVGAKVA